jgi:hypothetical protein
MKAIAKACNRFLHEREVLRFDFNAGSVGGKLAAYRFDGETTHS